MRWVEVSATNFAALGFVVGNDMGKTPTLKLVAHRKPQSMPAYR